MRSATVCSEDMGFPFAAQAARLLRQTQGRQDEEVTLITSAPVSRLPAPLWLKLNRQGWGIESGLHQRLDVSYNDDRCRIQNPKTMLIVGMFRRLANSLFMEWRQHRSHPEHLTTTDFQRVLGEELYSNAIDLVLKPSPSLKIPS